MVQVNVVGGPCGCDFYDLGLYGIGGVGIVEFDVYLGEGVVVGCEFACAEACGELAFVHAYVGVWRAEVALYFFGSEPVGLLEFHDGECSSRFVESSAAPLESTCEAGVDFASGAEFVGGGCIFSAVDECVKVFGECWNELTTGISLCCEGEGGSAECKTE